MNLHVVTQNMSINNGDPERRWADFNEIMLSKRPDIVVLQEVSSDIGYLAARSLTAKLGPDFTMHYEAVYPGQENEQGMAVISQLKTAQSYTSEFTNVGNQSQIVELKAKNSAIVVGNVHQRAAPQEENKRLSSVKQLTGLFKTEYTDSMKIIAGDFNAMPFYPVILSMKGRGYNSAHKTVYGKEPRATFPTMSAAELVEGRYLKPDEIAQLKKIARFAFAAASNKPEMPAYTTDYIFTKDAGKAVTAQLIIAKDATSQPVSDHMVISSQFKIECRNY